MRRIVVSEFLSLDGVMEGALWTFDYWTDQITEYKNAELFASDALLMGRVTYDGFAQEWPPRADQNPYAERMNGLPKYVVSTTLHTLTWHNAHLIADRVAAQVADLKQQPGEQILIFGSSRLVQSLMPHGLIDEYRLLIFPLVLGQGQRLFGEQPEAKLTLVHTQVFQSGVVALTYHPAAVLPRSAREEGTGG